MIPTLDGVWGKVLAINDRFDRGWRDQDLRFLTNALAGEAGELCNDTKHLYGGGTHKVSVTIAQLLDEAADVFVYLTMYVEAIRGKAWGDEGRMPPEFPDVVNEKLEVVRKRFADGATGDRK